MPARITKNRLGEFIAALREMGGSSGNVSLRTYLEWEEEFYWRVQGHLIDRGKVVAGRGRGGSVRLTETEIESGSTPEQEQPEVPPTPQDKIASERDLYQPLKKTIENTWINRFGFDEVLVGETHSRGSKPTGGTFTRPDITAVGIRRYRYLPKRLEVVTFEVKASGSVGVMGILEAIAHREAAHRSYVVYATSKSDFDAGSESDRILELSQKYGIGVLVADSPESVEGWEIVLDAVLHEPDPARLDQFLADLPSDKTKERLSKWQG